MSFPATPEDLTADWLSATLKRTVTDFRVERFGEGAGIIGQVTRVHLDTPDGSQSIIAKFPSPAPENRAVAATYDMYGREVAFYTRIAANIAMRTPRCFFGQHDPETQNFCLLLEDLGQYRIGDQVSGCSKADAEAVVRGLARFHASGWQPDASLDLLSHDNPAQRDGMIAGFQAGWPVVAEKFADVLPHGADLLASRLPEVTPALLTEMCTAPVCLSHADVRLDNIFFADDEVMFVDWQSVCTSSPEQDLAYFLTQSVEPNPDLQQTLRHLYYTALTGAGINYEQQVFERRYRVSALYLMNYAVVIAGTLDMSNERGQALARTLIDGAFHAFEDLNLVELLQ